MKNGGKNRMNEIVRNKEGKNRNSRFGVDDTNSVYASAVPSYRFSYQSPFIPLSFCASLFPYLCAITLTKFVH
jgi:hypothetical protein